MSVSSEVEGSDQPAVTETLHCAVCGRELSEADLREGLGGGLLLCAYCRVEQESCGCGDVG